MFIFIIILSFIVGILACTRLATYISPPPANLLILLFIPWVVLYFFSENRMISDIRYYYLSFILGMCSYWTYFETMKKIK